MILCILRRKSSSHATLDYEKALYWYKSLNEGKNCKVSQVIFKVTNTLVSGKTKQSFKS